MKVLQATSTSVLVTLPQEYGVQNLDKVFFIEMKNNYVDGDILPNMILKYKEIMSYQTVLGRKKRIHSFKLLE